MQVPREATSFSAYVSVVYNAIRAQMGSSQVVVVVFDEPEVLTAAKREEQARRDATRNKKVPVYSDDISPFPRTDAYTVEELTTCANCHDIVGCRAARMRFFDECGVQVMQRLQTTIDRWSEAGFKTVLLFDGLDPRGASRLIGSPREPQIWGSDLEVAALFAHPPEGEGDLKLALIEDRVRKIVSMEQPPDLFKDVKLHLSVTIDTDSIALELLEHGRRSVQCPDMNTAVKGVLCMRERSQKRDSWDDSESNSVYWVVDYEKLYGCIQKDMWGLRRSPTASEERLAMTLMVAGWIVSGCDYSDVKGMNAALVFEILPSMVNAMPETLSMMQKAWEGDRQQVLSLTLAIQRICHLAARAYGDRPRAKKAVVEDLLHVDQEPLRRGAWTLAYWCKNEQKGDLSDFGFFCA